ncbi:Uncharacterized protein PBTT_06821 [Plasmodiophora brassicae]|uniref:Uncharacterized protein n=1 Tax=Plasmodiophora brassicae TaxID=37360 RepID=A0A0G4J8S5_PLABS|nr:hypothetical protein PBRA_003544 [Plasmodiophora brassicae]SPQ99897.1 unnamed protein product [Plasmodiophora brassicae]
MVAACARMQLGMEMCLSWLLDMVTVKRPPSKPMDSMAGPDRLDDDQVGRAKVPSVVGEPDVFDDDIVLDIAYDDDDLYHDEGAPTQVDFDWNCLKAPAPTRIEPGAAPPVQAPGPGHDD